MGISPSFFAAKFGITERDLESYLSEALSAGGEYADLYFEYLSTSSIGIDEGIVKSASESVTMGVGIRVIAGERTGYAYSDDLSPEKIRKAARVAALIAPGSGERGENRLYRGVQAQSVSDGDLAPRIELGGARGPGETRRCGRSGV